MRIGEILRKIARQESLTDEEVKFFVDFFKAVEDDVDGRYGKKGEKEQHEKIKSFP